jgi:hypothetical protein
VRASFSGWEPRGDGEVGFVHLEVEGRNYKKMVWLGVAGSASEDIGAARRRAVRKSLRELVLDVVFDECPEFRDMWTLVGSQ